MILAIEKNTIVFRIADDHIHYRTLEHFIKRNFTKVRRTYNSITVHHSQDEQIKRNYMLKWIKNIIKTKEITSKLEINNTLPITIETTKKNYVPVKYLNISIKLLQNRRLLFIFEEANIKITKKFIKFFTNSNAQLMHNGKAVLIEINTQETLLKLKQILQVKTIQNSVVQFIYTKSQMHSFIQSLKEKDKTQKLLQESYNLLGATKESDINKVKYNYKQLLKKYHPDRVYAQNPNKINFYTHKFQQVQNAYDTIQKYRAS